MGKMIIIMQLYLQNWDRFCAHRVTQPWTEKGLKHPQTLVENMWGSFVLLFFNQNLLTMYWKLIELINWKLRDRQDEIFSLIHIKQQKGLFKDPLLCKMLGCVCVYYNPPICSFCIFVCLIFGDRILLYIPGWPKIHYVAQATLHS